MLKSINSGRVGHSALQKHIVIRHNFVLDMGTIEK